MKTQPRRLIPAPLLPAAVRLLALAALLILAAGTGRMAGQEPGAADTDGDGLPDPWELLHFGNLSAKPGDDPDGDSLSNRLELETGTDPRVADSDRDGHLDWMGIPGYLLQEKWPEPDDSPAIAPAARQKLNRPGATQFFHPGAAVESVGDNFFRERLRGTLTAPLTGEYEFWIAGDNGCELWLGVDASRFGARRLAGLPMEDSRTLPNEWDKYPSQKSRAVKLLAGREYHLEIIHRDFRGYDHVAIAWKPPGGTREPVPAGVLKSWVVDPEDRDDDGMRDRWETAHGLAVGRQDAMEDPDGDGIVNVIEHDVGSDPHDAGAVPGMLDWSRWFGPQGRILPETVMPGVCAREPDHRGAVHGLRLPAGVSRDAIDRLRGTLAAPEDGYYSFWITGKGSAALSLSPDSHAFNKRLIAGCAPNNSSGCSHGGRYHERSMPVRLRKGGQYFIEAMLSRSVGSALPMGICWAREQPRDWSETGLGGVAKGSWTEQDGTLTAEVGWASGFGGTQGDAVWFRNAAANGVVEAVCRMDPQTPPANGAGGGLMLRASDDPYAPFAAIILDSQMKIRLHGRTVAFAEVRTLDQSTSVSGTLRTLDSVWLRIRSDGENCRAFFSPDGVTWHGAGQIKLAFGDGLIAGPVAWGGNSKEPSVLTFSDLVMGDPWSSAEVPDEVLATCRPDPEDVDADSLPDAWERLHGLDPARASGADGEAADPDGDGLTNAREYLLDSDPFKAGGVPGFLTLERWNNIPGSQVADLLASRKFKGPPDVAVLVSRPDLEGGADNNYGQRLRGTLVAPATGTYRFWIAGDNGCALSLSPDARNSGLREIASLAGAGGASTGLHEWDRFARQASAEIELTGGGEYLIEILHKEGRGADHVAVAWEYRTPDGTAQAREILPSRVLRSYVRDLEDLDQDGLPDEWEVLHGLSPEDNGFHDPIREGAGGDHDHDGLTNLEEYRLGTHPGVADTDGDGLPDLDEVRVYGSDPLEKDAIPPRLHTDFALDRVISPLGTWLVSSDGMLTSTAMRGAASFKFTVDAAGLYVVRLEARVIGENGYTPPVPVSALVDGVEIGRGDVTAAEGGLSWITRWIAAGTHDVTIQNRNSKFTVNLAISSLKLLKMVGEDQSGDGLPDWYEQIIQPANSFALSGVEDLEMQVSPACIEGTSRMLGAVSLGVDGKPCDVLPGIGTGWYANVPLAEKSRTVVEGRFEGGTVTRRLNLVWSAVDPFLIEDRIHVRVGDAMKFAVAALAPVDVESGFSLTLDGQEIFSGLSGTEVIVRFERSGEQVLEATRSGKTGTDTRRITVSAMKADFGPTFSIAAEVPRDWNLPGVSTLLTLESDPLLQLGAITPLQPAGLRTTAVWKEKSAAQPMVLARLSQGGPILAAACVNVFRLVDAAVSGDAHVVEILPDGTRVVEISYLIEGRIPDDFSMWIDFAVTDAVFADGSTRYLLTAADFDESGVARIKIYKAAGEGPAFVCHWNRLFENDTDASPASETEREEAE